MPHARVPDIILASGSRSRRDLLQGAGVAFRAIPSEVDEHAIRDAVLAKDAGTEPAYIAELLATAKAMGVSAKFPDAVVIGADQVLALAGKVYGKPAGLDAARTHLLELRGQTHQLHSAIAIAQRGVANWVHVDTAHMTMRAFSAAFLDGYLDQAGIDVCSSVGAYQLEAAGVQLFERIDGDYFTILGLPLLPLLTALRSRQAIGD